MLPYLCSQPASHACNAMQCTYLSYLPTRLSVFRTNADQTEPALPTLHLEGDREPIEFSLSRVPCVVGIEGKCQNAACLLRNRGLNSRLKQLSKIDAAHDGCTPCACACALARRGIEYRTVPYLGNENVSFLFLSLFIPCRLWIYVLYRIEIRSHLRLRF